MKQPKTKVHLLKFGIANHLFAGVKYFDKAADKNKIKATVKMKTCDWSAMVKGLSKLHVVADKQKAPYFVMAEFDHLEDNGEHRRHNRYVVGHYGAVLDLDDNPDLAAIEKWLAVKCLNYVIYSTHSHDPLGDKGERYRLVLPYSGVVDPYDQAKVIYGLAKDMTGLIPDMNIDRCSEVASQPMFMHSAPKARVGEAFFDSRTGRKWLNPDEYIEVAEEDILNGVPSAGKAALPSETDKLDVGNRRPTYTRFIGKWASEGLSMEEVIDNLLAVDANSDVPLGKSEVIKTVKGVWDTITRNSNSFGYRELVSRIEVMVDGDDVGGKSAVLDSLYHVIGCSKEQLNTAQLEDLKKRIYDKAGGAIKKADIANNIEIQHTDNREEKYQDLKGDKEKYNIKVRQTLREYLLVSSKGKIIQTHANSNNLISRDVFNDLCNRYLNRLRPEFFDLFSEAKGSLTNWAYVNNNELIRVVEDIVYVPGQKKVFKVDDKFYYNTYRDSGLVGESEADITPMLNHFKLVCNYDEESTTALLRWFAFIMQNPGKKMDYMPIIYAGHGVGKSMLLKTIFKPLLGKNNAMTSSNEMMKEKYNDYLATTQLVVFEELDFGRSVADSKSQINAIKDLITNEEFSAREFGGGWSPNTVNIANFIAFSNDSRSLTIDRTERRFFCIKGPQLQITNPIHPLYDPDYFRKIHKWLAVEENIDSMYAYFMEYDLGKFDEHERVENDFTKELKFENADWPLNELMALQQNPDSPLHDSFEFDVLTYRGIKRMIALAATGKYEEDMAEKLSKVGGNNKAHRLLIKALESAGYVKAITSNSSGNRIKLQGRKEVLWLSPAYIARKRSATIDHVKYRDELIEFNLEVGSYIKQVNKEQREENAIDEGEFDEFGEFD